jgi:MipA family protein
MEKLSALVLVAFCGTATAQTPTTNPMPDGSRDMYVGLGAVSMPRYEGSSRRRVSALPVVQVEWSNGIFVSGLSAGMHLSGQPSLEYGPLLAFQPRRSESGIGGSVGGVNGSGTGTLLPNTGDITKLGEGRGARLVGMGDVEARLLGGGFLNVYLSPSLRLINTVLAGAGNERNGATWRIGLQHLAADIDARRRVSVTVGANLVNRHYNQDYFGVTEAQAHTSVNHVYTPSGGVKDVFAQARLNWSLSPSWMLTSTLQASRLQGDAKNSPLVERPTNVTVTTALAYRF